MSTGNQAERNKISVSIIIDHDELITNNVFPDEIKYNIIQSPYYLLIFIPRKDIIKINCFPISNKHIKKILIKIEEFSPEMVKGISKIFKELNLSKDIIHTTGICFELSDCYYESFLKAEILDSETLEKIKQKFMRLEKVIEIRFENVKVLS
jgi:hypothetical protein